MINPRSINVLYFILLCALGAKLLGADWLTSAFVLVVASFISAVVALINFLPRWPR